MATTILSDSALTSELSGSKVFLLEPLLAVAAAAFWLVALPFAAVSLMAVRVWDAFVALVTGHALRPNPLILRPDTGEECFCGAGLEARRAGLTVPKRFSVHSGSGGGFSHLLQFAKTRPKWGSLSRFGKARWRVCSLSAANTPIEIDEGLLATGCLS